MTYGPAMVNGPFGIVIANGSGLTGVAGNGTMVGLSDRIKLRPLICARKNDTTFMASEESAIKAVLQESRQRVGATRGRTDSRDGEWRCIVPVPEFRVVIDRQACRLCKRCIENCSFAH